MTLHRMTSILPAESPFPIPTSAGLGDGAAGGEATAHAVPDVPFVSAFTQEPCTLDSEIYRDMRWCPNCAGQPVFVEIFEFESGRMGGCLGCGEERVVRFTRMVA